MYVMIIIGANLQAQNNHHINISSNLSISSLIDRSVSSLHYQGIGGYGSVGYSLESERFLMNLNFNLGYSFFNDNLSKTSFQLKNIEIIEFKVNLDALIRIYIIENKKIDMFTGVNINYQYIYSDFLKFSNNGINKTQSLPLSWSNMLKYKFSLFGLNLKYYFKLDIPLMIYSKRPRYSIPEWGNKDIGERNLNFFFNNYFYLFSSTSINYIMSSNNEIELYYKWNYMSLSKPNPLYYAKHLIGAKFRFYL